MTRRQYPPRLWALVGYPGSGKSTFATQMAGPMLVVDADHRFAEVLELAAGDVLELSSSPADNVDTQRINTLLAANMPGSKVSTIVVDSLTSIITPLVVQAIMDNDAGLNKNRAAAFKAKAMAMRQLQDAVTRWGTDCLWIYHLQDSRDNKAREVTRATVSETELARLTRSINMQLEIVRDGEKRGVRVVWARRGRSGMTLWDESGTWAEMPARIEVAVYDGLSKADQARIEQETPAHFPNTQTAIAWGFEQGAFKAIQHARSAYKKLEREQEPGTTAQEMSALWIANVEARLLALAKETTGGNDLSPLEIASPTDDEGFICQDCGQPLTKYEASNGKTYTVSELVDMGANLRGGGIVCGPCLKIRKGRVKVEG